ncbi:12143_t:CDS:1, partial [Entrophospora sp. SA101]
EDILDNSNIKKLNDNNNDGNNNDKATIQNDQIITIDNNNNQTSISNSKSYKIITHKIILPSGEKVNKTYQLNDN